MTGRNYLFINVCELTILYFAIVFLNNGIIYYLGNALIIGLCIIAFIAFLAAVFRSYRLERFAYIFTVIGSVMLVTTCLFSVVPYCL